MAIRRTLIVALLSLLPSSHLAAQRAAAPADYTGYWVSEVTEKWRFRMLVPDKNDYIQVPLNPEGRRVAALWDPAKDEASGEACRSYGAGGIMQVPGRLHITWQDENTLRVDTDSGQQTRLFHFSGSPPANEKPSWQGYSAAQWGGDRPRDRRDGQGGPVQDKEGRLVVAEAQQKPADYLQVITTRMRPGYLQKNGVPYSATTSMTEYFDVVKEPNGDQWLVVKSIIEDPQYLTRSLIRSTHFRKQADAAGWNPTACSAR